MSLIDDLTALKADLHSIPTDLGLPQYRRVVVRKSILLDDDLTSYYKDFWLSPKVHIANMPTRYIGMELAKTGVVISQDDLFCKNFPRLYSKTFLEEDVEFYIIDPQLNEDGRVIDGLQCRLLEIRDDRSLSWQLLFRKDPDNTPIEPVPIEPISSQGIGIVDPTFVAVLVDFDDPTYYYYGGNRSNGLWQINRFSKATLEKQSATQTGIPIYSSLVGAWEFRSTLVYSEVE